MDAANKSNLPMVVGIAAILLFGANMLFRGGSSGANQPEYARCLSSWDGSNRAFVEEVRARLREPSSFEHMSTVVGDDLGRGSRRIVMTYRARNGFGGMNIETAQAILSPTNCRIRELRV